MDDQANGLYRAERSTAAFTMRPLETPGEAHRLVNGYRTTSWWNARYKTKHTLGIIFTEEWETKGYDAAFHYPTVDQWQAGWGGHIDMTPNGRTLGILLHELAHFVTYTECDELHQEHGWQFVRNYTHLVWCVMGKVRAEELAHAFKNNGVSCKP